MSFPHGVQCKTCFTQPESISLSLLSFFFNRWESSIVYAFPKGCDARFWQTFADATTVAAKCEDIVWDGRRCDDEVSLTKDPASLYPPRRKRSCPSIWSTPRTCRLCSMSRMKRMTR